MSHSPVPTKIPRTADRKPRLGKLNFFQDTPCAPKIAVLHLLTVPQARVVSSVGRAPALQAGCHWFESSTTHLNINKLSSAGKPSRSVRFVLNL